MVLHHTYNQLHIAFIMRSMRAVVFIWFLTFAAIAISIASCNGNPGAPCVESEKQALLIFKQDLKDPANRLFSWADEGGDCCSWTGVVCDNSTGHVRELHLGNSAFMDLNSSLSGKLNPSLLNLKHLLYLNLSNNYFQGTRIPSFLGSFKILTHLDLSFAFFEGMIPHQLGNLSSICDLRLSGDGLKVENFQWISGLSHLKHLYMNHVNLSKASDWLQVTSMLPSLVELRLSNCGLDHIPLLNSINFTSLAILDLSDNYFRSLMPRWIFSLRNLVSVYLYQCALQGPIPRSPPNSTSLKEIDFSSNDVLNLSIPEWLFNQKYLTHLNLAYNSFQGPLPGGLLNMSRLKVLSLNSNSFNSTIPRSLYSLNYLESLILSDNQFDGEVLSSIGNLTSLSVLNLRNNHLGGKVPHSLGNLCNLITLDLSDNNFSGNSSHLFESLSACSSCHVESLGLGRNNLSGHLTAQIGNLKNLSVLDLSENHFDGDLPEIIGQLKMLTYLDISYNSFKGVVSEVHFTDHTRLKSFIAKGNSLTLDTRRDWLPPFQLEALFLDSWLLAPEFPLWLRGQRQMNMLSLSNTGISDTIPNWFWNSSHDQLEYLNLSHNHLYGDIEYIDGWSSVIDLSSNKFNGTLPLVSSTVSVLDLSNSSFSGSVFDFFCDKINAPHQLSRLYVGNNRLSGKIPDCFMNWPELNLLDLENNDLRGNIPSSIGHLVKLNSLHLRSNHLFGELPLSMQNCTSLLILDLGENKFSGRLPLWIGKSLPILVVLSFRSNKLQGDIPDQLCNLKHLQILDLAHNNLSGTIPRCFRNLSAMVNESRSDGVVVSLEFNYGAASGKYIDNMLLVTKGRKVEYSSILGLVTSMDLSDNNISGEIPEQLTDLISLQSLNLSQNILTGRIPSKIGNMHKLESVDLSMNHLYGEIPASITSLTFLSHLNLSYNNFSGRIPEGTQLQSLDQSSFVGNELCGPPLIKNCSATKVIPPTVDQHDRGYDLLKDEWFYLSLGLGFMVGFWSILGSLLVNLPWSFKFSRFLNSIVLKLYDVIVEYI